MIEVAKVYVTKIMQERTSFDGLTLKVRGLYHD